MRHERAFRIERAILPSDMGAAALRSESGGRRGHRKRRPPEGETVQAERNDPRRLNTPYIKALEKDVEHRLATDTLLEQCERNPAPTPLALASPSPRAQEHRGLRDVLHKTIDNATGRCLNGVSVPEEECAMSTEVIDKPATKAAKKRAVKKPTKAKALKKTTRKAKGKKTFREQTCVNIYIPAKKKLEARVKSLKAKGVKTSSNKIINELVCKLVGVKLPTKAAS